MSAITDQDFRARVSAALVREREAHYDPDYCLSRLVSALSELLTAESRSDAVAHAARVAALAQRAAVEGDPILKYPRSIAPLGPGRKRGGMQ
jgi:hypothetical protein